MGSCGGAGAGDAGGGGDGHDDGEEGALGVEVTVGVTVAGLVSAVSVTSRTT